MRILRRVLHAAPEWAPNLTVGNTLTYTVFMGLAVALQNSVTHTGSSDHTGLTILMIVVTICMVYETLREVELYLEAIRLSYKPDEMCEELRDPRCFWWITTRLRDTTIDSPLAVARCIVRYRWAQESMRARIIRLFPLVMPAKLVALYERRHTNDAT